MTVYAGNIIYASDINALAPIKAIKTADESLTSSTTLQNDNELFVSVRANTNYKVDLTLLALQGGAGAIDMKLAWTFPSGCTLDLAVVGPHSTWPPTVATDLEVEWAAWQNVTSSPSGTIAFGTTTTTFSYHVRGTLRVGSTAGSLQLQWAQNTSSATAVTVRSGSSLILTPLPA